MNTIKPRPRGRPKSDNPRATALLLKLNDLEARIISKKAKKAGKPVATWIREVAVAA